MTEMAMSPADVRAVTSGNNGMFGGDGIGGFILIFFILAMSGGGFGFGNNRNDAVEQEILSNQHFNALDARITSIGNGICDSTFALNNSIVGEGRALQGQLAECCCGIQNAIREEGAATRSLIQTNEIQALRDKVTDLQLQASQCRQNEYLVGKLTPPCPVPAYMVANPYCGYNPCGGCNGF